MVPPEPSIIDDEVAKAYVADPSAISLRLATAISDSAASILSESKSCLALDGLTSLSEVAATALAHQQSWEYPNLPPHIAKKVKCEPAISLNGLRAIPPGLAQGLSMFSGRVLSLDGATDIPHESLAHLAHTQTECLSLGGLTSLSETEARTICKFNGCLGLNGLSKFSISVICHLAQFEHPLSLGAITELSDLLAAILSQTRSISLSLDGVTTLSDTAAELFSTIHPDATLSLCGLTQISDTAAKHFASFRGDELYLNGIRTVSDVAAFSLAKCMSDVYLEGLENASKAAASALGFRDPDQFSQR